MKKALFLGIVFTIAVSSSWAQAEVLFTCKPRNPGSGPIYQVTRIDWREDSNYELFYVIADPGPNESWHWFKHAKAGGQGLADVTWVPLKESYFMFSMSVPNEPQYAHFYSSAATVVIDIKMDHTNPRSPNSQGPRTDYDCFRP